MRNDCIRKQARVEVQTVYGLFVNKECRICGTTGYNASARLMQAYTREFDAIAQRVALERTRDNDIIRFPNIHDWEINENYCRTEFYVWPFPLLVVHYEDFER
jgi:hypothetical protein